MNLKNLSRSFFKNLKRFIDVFFVPKENKENIQTETMNFKSITKEKTATLDPEQKRIVMDIIDKRETGITEPLLLSSGDVNGGLRDKNNIKEIKKFPLTFDNILEIIANFYEVSMTDILGSCRRRNLVRARQVVVYVVREILHESYPDIGRRLGNRDHTTILYAYYKIQGALKFDQKLVQEIDSIYRHCKEEKWLIPVIASHETSNAKKQQEQNIEAEIEMEVKNLEVERERLLKKRKEQVIIKSLDELPNYQLSTENSERDNIILIKYREGFNLEKIGKEMNITRERARQVIRKKLIVEAKGAIKQGTEFNLTEFFKQEKNNHLIARAKKEGWTNKQKSNKGKKMVLK